MPAGAASASAATGCRPGVMTTTSRPSRARAAAIPARTSDDLPQPDGPTTASNETAPSRSRQASTSRLPAEERLGVVRRRRPAARGRGRRGWARGVRRPCSEGPGAGSPARAPTRSGPGSRPRSRTRVARARWSVREGVGLPSGPVLRPREQAPPALPGGLLAHEAAAPRARTRSWWPLAARPRRAAPRPPGAARRGGRPPPAPPATRRARSAAGRATGPAPAAPGTRPVRARHRPADRGPGRRGRSNCRWSSSSWCSASR